jgi:hypothetical protein
MLQRNKNYQKPKMQEKIWFYKILTDLPHIPKQYINQALAIVSNHNQTSADESYNRDYLPMSDRALVDLDGKKTTSRRTPRWAIGKEIENWVRDNITPEFLDTGVATSEGAGDTTGPHTDKTRSWTYMYLISKSNDQQLTKWWHEDGQPVYRDPGTYLNSFDSCKELCSVEIPMNTWVCLNVRILHSVHNIKQYRNAIHVSFPMMPFKV